MVNSRVPVLYSVRRVKKYPDYAFAVLPIPATNPRPVSTNNADMAQPFRQFSEPFVNVGIVWLLNPLAAVADVRSLAHGVNPHAAVADVRSLAKRSQPRSNPARRRPNPIAR